MNKLRPYMSVAALALAVSLTGCSAAGTSSPGQAGTAVTGTQSAVTVASVEEDTHFDSDDLSWDPASEVAVTLADGASTVAAGSASGAVKVDGGTVTISAAGTYRLSGSLSDGQVVIAAGEEDVVRIILDGAEVSSSAGSPFVVQSANEAVVYLEEGSTNSLEDAATYADQGTDSPNAALYSMADLTIAGTGALTVSGRYNDGIVSKDGLVLAAGNVSVVAADDGIRGKDYTVLLDGAYTVTAGGDGVKADNDADEGRGWLLVSGGSLAVKAGDDGVKAVTRLTVTGGTLTVEESEEGLESAHIAVTGGTVAAAGSAGMAVTPATSSTQSGAQITFGTAVPAGTTIQLADSSGQVVATFVTAKQTASLVYSSAAITAGEEYTVYTGGTAQVTAGVGAGSLDGAQQQGTVTAGEYTAARGPGGRR
jgi:hypothetical protein